MKTRKKISKIRQLFRRKSPKHTQKYFHRKYHGPFLNSILYTEPIYEIYSKENVSKSNMNLCCYKKVVPLNKLNKLKKKQSYVWRISGGLFPSV